MEFQAQTYNGVLTYVPEHCARVDPNDANLVDAAKFVPTESSYWTGQVGSMVPGFVLGGICAAGFVTMLLWICVRCCRRKRLARVPAAAETQFLTAGGYAASTPPTFLQFKYGRTARRRRWANALTAMMVVLAVGAVGCCAWGMGESIMQTNQVISNFWILVHEVEEVADAAELAMASISFSLTQLQPLKDAVGQSAGALITALAQAAGWGEQQATLVVGLLTSMPDGVLIQASESVNNTVLPLLRDDVSIAVDDVLDFEAPTMTIQDTWRFVILAVLFGLLILGILVATPLCFWMRWGRWAALAVALVWLLNAAVMLGGVGVFDQVESVSVEACLYSEDLVYRMVEQEMSGAAKQVTLNVLDYYLGVSNLTTILNQSVPDAVTGDDRYDPGAVDALFQALSGVSINLTTVFEAVQRANQTLNELGQREEVKAAVARLAELGLVPPNIVATLLDAMDAVVLLMSSTKDLVKQLSRSSVQPIYRGLKEYLCCDVHSAGYWAWLSWTVAGSVTLAFLVAATARVVWQTVYPEDRGWGAGDDDQGPLASVPPPDLHVSPAPQDHPVGAEALVAGAKLSEKSDLTLAAAKDWGPGSIEQDPPRGIPAHGLTSGTLL